MANYSLSNAWENARQRLALLEQYLDPITHRRLSGLGLCARHRFGAPCRESRISAGRIVAPIDQS